MAEDKPDSKRPKPASLTRTSDPPKEPERFSPHLFESFLANQGREIEIKAGELALEQARGKHSHEFSLRSIEAQLADRKSQREHRSAETTKTAVLIGGGLLSVTGVIVYAIFMKEPGLATEIIKAIILLGAGGGAGYGIGRSRKRDGDDSKPPAPGG